MQATKVKIAKKTLNFTNINALDGHTNAWIFY